jgi:hypothetical protein
VGIYSKKVERKSGFFGENTRISSKKAQATKESRLKTQ